MVRTLCRATSTVVGTSPIPIPLIQIIHLQHDPVSMPRSWNEKQMVAFQRTWVRPPRLWFSSHTTRHFLCPNSVWAAL